VEHYWAQHRTIKKINIWLKEAMVMLRMVLNCELAGIKMEAAKSCTVSTFNINITVFWDVMPGS